MTRAALLCAPVAAISLGGCGSVSADSYGLGHGDANYDALKAASERCAASGGAIRVRKGADTRDLANYDCVIGKAR